MSSSARRRLMKDFKYLQKNPKFGIAARPMGHNIMVWQAFIEGPADTLFEGATFPLTMTFKEEYPAKPPHVRFEAFVFHPNVYKDGNICLDLLQNNWSPLYNVSSILLAIQTLLSDPNPDSPANTRAAQLFTSDQREYLRQVRKCVEDSWLT